jgi:hypothetical protein
MREGGLKSWWFLGCFPQGLLVLAQFVMHCPGIFYVLGLQIEPLVVRVLSV